MRRFCCERLDDYLDDDLSEDDLVEFQLCVADCPDCQSELARQLEVDQALQEAWDSQETPPFALPQAQRKVAESETARTPRGAAMLVTILAGVLILVATLWRNGPQENEQEVVKQSETTDSDVAPAPPAVVKFDANAIGVVDEISNEEFTLVRVYSTYSAND